MIFKYFKYNNLNKSWYDTNIYYTICNSQLERPELTKNLYNFSFKNKIFNDSYEEFMIHDYSNHVKIYKISKIIDDKIYVIGKLIQLPNKNLADDGISLHAKDHVKNSLFDKSYRFYDTFTTRASTIRWITHHNTNNTITLNIR